MKHIGILAHSAEGSALCYRTACHEGARRLGEHMHPDITVSVIPMGTSMPHWHALDLEPIREIMAMTVDRLKAAGCDFFVCPDNTAHMALETQGAPFSLPGLHIAEVVAAKANADGCKKVGILGTKWTMEGVVYPEAFKRRGLDFCSPDKDDRAYVDKVIFDELCNGIIRDEARVGYLNIIEKLKDEGCDVVLLGCTEIPLLITPDISPLPTLDSTRLLATAAVDVALGDQAMPVWRGGAIS